MAFVHSAVAKPPRPLHPILVHPTPSLSLSVTVSFSLSFVFFFFSLTLHPILMHPAPDPIAKHARFRLGQCGQTRFDHRILHVVKREVSADQRTLLRTEPKTALTTRYPSASHEMPSNVSVPNLRTVCVCEREREKEFHVSVPHLRIV